MTSPFVCQVCRSVVDWHGNQFEERIEIRTKDHSRSMASHVTAYYCKTCMSDRIAELKGSPSLQGSLL